MGAPETRARFQPEWTGTGHGRSVLLLDPDRTVRAVLANYLRSDGYRTVEAERGEDALFLAMERPLHALILGLHLPGMHAGEFCQRVRALQRFRHTPILCLVMPFEEPEMGRLFAAGADDFLLKPVSAVLLRTRLAGRILKTEALLESLARARPRDERDGDPGRGPTDPSGPHEVCALVSRLHCDVEGTPPSILLNRALAQIEMQRECVLRHGGRMESLTGDGIRAYFDGPHQAERASACALEILEISRSKSADGVAPAVGVHRGMALTSGSAYPGPVALGDAFAIAARLCDQAVGSSVIVSETVRAALEADTMFDFSGSTSVALRPGGARCKAHRLRGREAARAA